MSIFFIVASFFGYTDAHFYFGNNRLEIINTGSSPKLLVGDVEISFEHLSGIIIPELSKADSIPFKENINKNFIRFNAETRTEKHLVIHTNQTNIFQVVLGALCSGWRVSFLRYDAPQKDLISLSNQLPSFLRLSHDEDDSLTMHLPTKSLPLDEWLEENSTIKPPYHWGEDEWAITLFTSGSTGAPKGVCHSLSNILRGSRTHAEHFSFNDTERLCCLAPLHTVTAVRSLFISVVTEHTVIMLPQKNNESFLSFVSRIKEQQPSIIQAGPIFIKLLANYGEKLSGFFSTVRIITSAGAPLSLADKIKVENIHPFKVINGYGATEVLDIVLASPLNAQESGVALSHVKGVTTQLIPIKGIKNQYQLAYLSPSLYLGYLGEKSERKSIYYTGDIVQLNVKGEILFQGRMTQKFKGKNEEWIFPSLLEQWLKNQSLVIDAQVEVKKEENISGLCVFIEGDIPNFREWHSGLTLKIKEELGVEYTAVSHWEQKKIRRNLFGKLLKRSAVSI